jgi:subtilisin family serine protease
VATPGVDILVAAPDNTYRFSSGTSFAAAYASAVAALLVEREPGLSPDSAKRILISTAHGLGPAGRNAGFGAGLVDANQAVLAVGSQPSAQLPGPTAH